MTAGLKLLDVVAVGELNPDLILDGMAGLPRLGQEILAGRGFPGSRSTISRPG